MPVIKPGDKIELSNSDGLPYKIGNYVDDTYNPFFGNCESYAKNKLNRTNANLGFVKYPNRTWKICSYISRDSVYNFHYLRRNNNGTWSQKIGNIITNCFAKNGQIDLAKTKKSKKLEQSKLLKEFI